MDFRCNILKRNAHLYMPRCCAVHNLACTVQPKGYTGMRQVWVMEYRASENALSNLESITLLSSLKWMGFFKYFIVDKKLNDVLIDTRMEKNAKILMSNCQN